MRSGHFVKEAIMIKTIEPVNPNMDVHLRARQVPVIHFLPLLGGHKSTHQRTFPLNIHFHKLSQKEACKTIFLRVCNADYSS
jgi:hypothetical protein